jgi:hypothetical protein
MCKRSVFPLTTIVTLCRWKWRICEKVMADRFSDPNPQEQGTTIFTWIQSGSID